MLGVGAGPAPGEASLIARDAPIALVIDQSSGQVLFSKDADRRFVPASMTKIMTTYVAFELMDEGRIKPDTVFEMSDEAAKEWTGQGSRMFLEAGDRVRVADLLTAITTISANDATIMLAEGSLGSVSRWVERMNAEARRLGMNNTRFGTPNGWPDEGRTFTTAADLAKLTRALIERHPEEYRQYYGKSEFGYNGIAQSNHNPITGVVPGADGVKTGYTNHAGYGFVGSAKRGDTRIVMVVGAMGSSRDRAEVSRNLVEWGFDGFQRKSLFGKAAVVGQAEVQDGDRFSVDLTTSHPVVLACPSRSACEQDATIRYRGPLRAPIEKGEHVADLVVATPGLPDTVIPLEAADKVEQASFPRRVVNGLAGVFR